MNNVNFGTKNTLLKCVEVLVGALGAESSTRSDSFHHQVKYVIVMRRLAVVDSFGLGVSRGVSSCFRLKAIASGMTRKQIVEERERVLHNFGGTTTKKTNNKPGQMSQFVKKTGSKKKKT